jgi:probable F420-dependent oxidoreductase
VRHTRETRTLLGDGPLLAPEQTIVIDDDLSVAMASAHGYAAQYIGTFANYERSFRRLGYSDDDLANGGSDRLVSDLVAVGSADSVGARLSEQLAAGADHVCVQPWQGGDGDPRPMLRSLAPVVPGKTSTD